MGELCDRSAVELLDSCLARIERVNPALNAMVALNEALESELQRFAECRRPVPDLKALAKRPG